MHQIAFTDRLTKLDSVENAAKLEYKMALEQSQADNNQVCEANLFLLIFIITI